MIFVTLANKIIRLSEDEADALKNAGVLTFYNIVYIYIYIVHLLVWIINLQDARCRHQNSRVLMLKQALEGKLRGTAAMERLVIKVSEKQRVKKLYFPKL
jgi:hypothetical protein